MKTILQILKAEYPNLDYQDGAFYENKESEDFLLDDEGVQIDADHVIRNHYWHLLNTTVDSNYIKEYCGGYYESFTNA